MSGYYWLKLYTEILHDPKIMRLSPPVRLRFYECLVLARDCDKGGDLPPSEDAAFVFRIPEDQYESEMMELQRSGLVEKNGNWHLPKFSERQSALSGAERARMHRQTKQKEEYEKDGICYPEDSNEDVKESNEPVTERYNDRNESLHREEKIRIDKIRVEEDSKIAASPAISDSITNVSNTRVWSEVTGMVAIPGSEISKVLPALDALRIRFPNQDELIAYLKRYYEDWQKRKRKDGATYSRTNCAWLYDLAVAEETLKTEVAEKVKAANKEYFENNRPKPDCKIWGGNGVYNKDGRFIKCSCMKGSK